MFVPFLPQTFILQKVSFCSLYVVHKYKLPREPLDYSLSSKKGVWSKTLKNARANTMKLIVQVKICSVSQPSNYSSATHMMIQADGLSFPSSQHGDYSQKQQCSGCSKPGSRCMLWSRIEKDATLRPRCIEPQPTFLKYYKRVAAWSPGLSRAHLTWLTEPLAELF